MRIHRSYMTSSLVHVLLSFVLHFNLTHAYPSSIWSFSVDESPAPSPQDGPSLSAHASRNPALIPYQVAGIVGAYFIVASTFLILLLVVGRRLRRKTLSERGVHKMEMVRPNTNAIAIGNKEMSPVSPIKQWESPTDSESMNLWPTANAKQTWVKPSGASHSSQPSMNGSISTFDENVIETDRAKAQSEMERLYAAVAIHDAEQEAKKSQASQKSPRQEQFAVPIPSPRPEPYYSTSLRSPVQGQFVPLASPQSGHFVYGQQPPMSPNQLSHPMAPTPIPSATSPPSSPRETRSSGRMSKGPLSFFSSRSRSSSDKDSFRSSIKGMPISNPLGSPRLKNSVGMVGETVMSPRLYAPGPPPPTPGLKNANIGVAVMPTIEQDEELSATPQLQEKASQGMGRAAPPRPLALNPPSSIGQKPLGELPLRSYPTPPQSAPHYKTQYADRRESRVNPGPKTGVPYPHSPYMPFSPVTPLSATIKTGKDLKQAKKMAALAERDMVMSDEEIWGS